MAGKLKKRAGKKLKELGTGFKLRFRRGFKPKNVREAVVAKHHLEGSIAFKKRIGELLVKHKSELANGIVPKAITDFIGEQNAPGSKDFPGKHFLNFYVNSDTGKVTFHPAARVVAEAFTYGQYFMYYNLHDIPPIASEPAPMQVLRYGLALSGFFVPELAAGTYAASKRTISGAKKVHGKLVDTAINHNQKLIDAHEAKLSEVKAFIKKSMEADERRTQKKIEDAEREILEAVRVFKQGRKALRAA
ncbi:hypothetical protein ACFLQ2_02675 [archaeon]